MNILTDYTSPYDLAMKELVHRKFIYADVYPPYYLASIGAHIFNIHNKTSPVTIMPCSGDIVDLRENIMMIAPISAMKSFIIRNFMAFITGLLYKSAVEARFVSSFTTAGIVGTAFHDPKGKKIETPGLLSTHPNCIIGIDEWDTVQRTMQTSHSSELLPALRSLLDSGIYDRWMAAGEIPPIDTHVTFWAGVQPGVYDTSGGLARRFLTIFYVPTAADKKFFVEQRRKQWNVAYNPVQTEQFKASLAHLILQMKEITRVEFAEETFDWIETRTSEMQEVQILEKFLIGMAIIRDPIVPVMCIRMDDERKRQCVRIIRWMRQMLMGPDLVLVQEILKDHHGSMSEIQLKMELSAFHYGWDEATAIINRYLRSHALRCPRTGIIELPEEEMYGQENQCNTVVR